MKPRISCGVILIGCGLSAAANTNDAISLAFALPVPQLRSISSETAQTNKTVAPQPQAETTLQLLGSPRLTLSRISSDFEPVAADNFSVSVRGSDLEMQVCRRLEEGGYLTRPEPETPLEHFLDRSFSPEVIHIGRHATASCTLYTAIVRKNPLCLLNPMFLFISW